MFDGFFLNEGIVVVFLLEEEFYRLGCSEDFSTTRILLVIN